MNYIGFENSLLMNNFMEIDFRKYYRVTFPNLTSFFFSWFGLFIYFGLIIFSISRKCYKDKPD